MASIAPGNLARIRELVAEFDALAAQKAAMFEDGTYSEARFLSLEGAMLNVAYPLVGCLAGSFGLRSPLPEVVK